MSLVHISIIPIILTSIGLDFQILYHICFKQVTPDVHIPAQKQKPKTTCLNREGTHF